MSYIPPDVAAYLAGYPGKKENLTHSKNLSFYRNEAPSTPDGDLIDTIHKTWRGQYDKLEVHHGYIQWLFPIREHGLNMSSQELYLHEREAMVKTPKIMTRLVTSYQMMLDFYGLVLSDTKTGAVVRGANWKERFENLATHPHNYLRITRILKCLGEMGYERWKGPLLERFIEEVYEQGTLARCAESLKDYWVNTMKDPIDRTRLHSLIAAKGMKREDTVLDDSPPKRRKMGTIPESGPLPRLLQNTNVWLHPKIPEGKKEMFTRWIVAYAGVVSKDLTKGVTHAVVDTDVSAELSSSVVAAPRGSYVVDSDWLMLSHKKKTRLPEEPFLIS